MWICFLVFCCCNVEIEARISGIFNTYNEALVRMKEYESRRMRAKAGYDKIQAQPYAELWMGTHEKGENFKIEAVNVTSKNGSVVKLGKKLRDVIGKDLPYLFKVLAVNQALSIQAHPDKLLAEQLHLKFPNDYKDSNHKPEMAIALTEFDAMVGFRSIDQIAAYLSHVNGVDA